MKLIAISSLLSSTILIPVDPSRANDLNSFATPALSNFAPEPNADAKMQPFMSARNVETQIKAVGISEDDSNDSSYINSLRKEKVKQNAMKKTKEQRRRDLCESLGRGC